jgi:hypothetical protein
LVYQLLQDLGHAQWGRAWRRIGFLPELFQHKE